MIIRVTVFMVGVLWVIIGIYTASAPIGRIAPAIGGVLLVVAGAFLCAVSVLNKRSRTSH